VRRLRGSTHRVGLYCDQNHWLHRDTTSNAGDAPWIADYVTAGKPRIKAAWLCHQYTDRPLDTNVAQFADRAALRAWANKGGTPATPTVDLSNVVAAARTDPGAAQGHQTHPADVRIVEAALKAEGLLSAKYASDGSFGSTTVAAYAALARPRTTRRPDRLDAAAHPRRGAARLGQAAAVRAAHRCPGQGEAGRGHGRARPRRRRRRAAQRREAAATDERRLLILLRALIRIAGNDRIAIGDPPQPVPGCRECADLVRQRAEAQAAKDCSKGDRLQCAAAPPRLARVHLTP
jgi:hypothetical protein